MPAKTPAVKGTAGYVPPGSMFLNHANASPDTTGSGRIEKIDRFHHQVWHFTDADSADLWANPPAGLVACAFQQNWNDSVATAVTMNANRQVRFNGTGNDNSIGHLHTWSAGGKFRATGTDNPPSSKGTAGWVSPGLAMYRGEHAAAPVERLDVKAFLGLRHRVYYFPDIDNSDTWAIPNGNRVITLAWQPKGLTDQVIPAMNASDEMMFYSNGTDAAGWVHVWTRG
jgi:hypothetical protein